MDFKENTPSPIALTFLRIKRGKLRLPGKHRAQLLYPLKIGGKLCPNSANRGSSFRSHRCWISALCRRWRCFGLSIFWGPSRIRTLRLALCNPPSLWTRVEGSSPGKRTLATLRFSSILRWKNAPRKCTPSIHRILAAVSGRKSLSLSFFSPHSHLMGRLSIRWRKLLI